MRIKMKRDAMGSDTGAVTSLYVKDQEYNVSDDLANCFLSTGDAVEVKDAGAAAKNKDAGNADENKSAGGKKK